MSKSALSLISFFIAVIGPANCAVAASISITSPISGITVTAGQALDVVVTRSADITSVAIVGDLIATTGGISPAQTGQNPLTFHIVVPANLAPGTYRIGAIDADSQHNTPRHVFAASNPISLVVDSAVSISRINAAPNYVSLRFTGDDRTVIVGATLTDGSNETVSDATDLTYTSEDTSVVRVVGAGRLIATGPGSTTVIVKYKGLQDTIRVSVPALKPGDLNGDHQVDLDDLAILRGSLNTIATGSNDARDLNHDGRIDALDARILVTLCTYAQCATHP